MGPTKMDQRRLNLSAIFKEVAARTKGVDLNAAGNSQWRSHQPAFFSEHLHLVQFHGKTKEDFFIRHGAIKLRHSKLLIALEKRKGSAKHRIGQVGFSKKIHTAIEFQKALDAFATSLSNMGECSATKNNRQPNA